MEARGAMMRIVRGYAPLFRGVRADPFGFARYRSGGHGRAMEPRLRVVTSMPLDVLFDDTGEVKATRIGHIGFSEVRQLLGEPQTALVVANIGEPLRWFRGDARFSVWKSEIESRLVPAEASAWSLDDYPDSRAYVGYLWMAAKKPVIVFEMSH